MSRELRWDKQKKVHKTDDESTTSKDLMWM